MTNHSILPAAFSTSSRRETLELAASPYSEDCAQIGTPNYGVRAHAECEALRKQLVRHAAAAGLVQPDSVKFRAKSNAHDFGEYYEVAVSFPEDDQVAAEYAYWLEGNLPEKWDAEARAELGLLTLEDL